MLNEHLLSSHSLMRPNLDPYNAYKLVIDQLNGPNRKQIVFPSSQFKFLSVSAQSHSPGTRETKYTKT